MVDRTVSQLARVSLDAGEPDKEGRAGAELECERRWHVTLDHAFQLAAMAVKRHTSDGAALGYDTRVQLAALWQQVTHGPFSSAQRPALGALDLVGRARRSAWMALGYQSRADSMLRYVECVQLAVPAFSQLIAVEVERAAQLSASAASEHTKAATPSDTTTHERDDQEVVRQQIKDALNRQTYGQFRDYAEQQYPGNVDQQALLVRQLQEQHYQQYMQQLYRHQQCTAAVADNTAGLSAVTVHEQQQHSADVAIVSETTDKHASETDHKLPPDVANSNGTAHPPEDCVDSATAASADNDEQQDSQEMLLQPARLWTHGDVDRFKTDVRRDCPDCVLTVGHGETVTVRVPTHEHGAHVHWQFATDAYDIGFGVWFEWGSSGEHGVSVHVNESSEEEDEDGAEEEGERSPDDPEKGELVVDGVHEARVSCVIPVYRRDSHREVYMGSHHYPGDGVYLLKFDNSYSLWRSKTLYYSVYYSR